MSHINEAVQAVKARIERAARAAGRDPSSIRLLAVSKTFGLDAVVEAARAGQRAFGENYVQEAIHKIDASESPAGVEWHLIGPLQSNKCGVVATHFHWVQTVDREKVAARLSALRPVSSAPLEVCIQVNISGEETKSGMEPEGARSLAEQVSAMPRLRLRGLMGIAGLGIPPEATRAQFRVLREVHDDLRGRGFDIDTLSMGMSADLEMAIAEGSTMVRVGTAIFGARNGKEG